MPNEQNPLAPLADSKRSHFQQTDAQLLASSAIAHPEEGMVFQLADGSIQGCNAAASSILGLTIEQIQGWTSSDSPWQVINEDGSPKRGETHPAMVALSTGKPVTNVVMGLYQPSGKLIWLLVNSQPLFQNQEVTPYAVVTTFADITQAKEAESSCTDFKQYWAPTSNPQRRRTVVIVDDCETDVETYQRYLKADSEYTYTTWVAETGEEGLKLCQQHQPDAILLDYLLPDLNGLEFLELLQNQVSNIATAVIMLTGQGDETIAVQAMKAGAADYLVKGRIKADGLQMTLSHVIETASLRAQLQQTEERLKLASQAAQMGIWEWNLNTNKIICSEEVGLMFGLPRGACPPNFEAFLYSVHTQDRQMVKQVAKTAIALRTKQDVEFRVVWADNSLHWLQLTGQVHIDDSGQAYRILGTIRDITNSKQAQLERQHQLERERLVMQIAQSMRRSLDLSEILQSTVEEVRQFLQTDRVLIFKVLPDGNGTVVKESVGSEWTPIVSTTIYDPCLVETYIEPYTQGLITAKSDIYNAGINPCHIEMLAQFQVRANLVVPILQGENLWGLLIAHHCAAPREWHQWDIDLLSSLATQVGIAIQQSELYLQAQVEIRERQLAEAALRQQTERERLVVESAQRIRQSLSLEEVLQTTVSEVRQFLCCDRVFIYRFQPDWSGKVIVESVADGCMPILSVQVEDTYFVETRGEDYRQGRIQTVADIYTAELTQCHIDLLAQFQIRANLAVPILQGEALWGLLVANQCHRPRSWQQLEIDLLSNLATQVAIAIQQSELYQQAQTEIRDRKQALEAQRVAREEAEAANRVKDEFLAVLSHEIRSPLNPILGWSKLLLSGRVHPAKVQEALTIIERNAKLQAELIEDLLDVSRILRGKLNLNVAQVSLQSIISQALETVRLAAEAKSIQVVTEYHPETLQVMGDSARLQQIIWNLLSNAVKFTPAGGLVQVRLESDRTHAKITVTDTGKGIEPDFLPYVFDYFRQADSATTRKFGGLGLGLAIVRHLTELHGGTVQAESEGEGQGATFTIRLPLLTVSDRQKDNDNDNNSLTSSLNGIKVLVVDDEVDSREFIVFVLELSGVSVTTAASGFAALEIVAQLKPDVIISDIGMPDMDGYMFLQQLRTLPPEQGGQIPAIALTAYAGDINQRQALAAGFQQHVTKPVEPDSITQAIAICLNRT